MKIFHFADADFAERERIVVKTQNILAEHYPNSSFTANKYNFEDVKMFWANKMLNPDIWVADIDDCVIFFRKFNIKNEYDKAGSLKQAVTAKHDKYGDCIFIDFAVAHATDANEAEIKKFFLEDPSARYILGARRGVVFLFSVAQARKLAEKAKDLNFIAETVTWASRLGVSQWT